MVYRDTPTIGVLLPHINWWYNNTIIQGIVNSTRKKRIRVRFFISSIFNSVEKISKNQSAGLKLINADTIDGLISISGGLCSIHTRDEVDAFFDGIDPLPVVTIGEPLRDYPLIGVDNEHAMTELVTHLIEKHGYRKIAFASGPKDNNEAILRLNAYKKVLRKYHIPLDEAYIVYGVFDKFFGNSIVHTLYDERKLKPDVIVCSNDAMAIGAYTQLKKRNIDIPGEVGLTGFDGIEDAYRLSPPLTTVKQPLFEQGTTAVEVLLTMIAGTKPPEDMFLKCRLIINPSCGCLTIPEYSSTSQEPRDSVSPGFDNRPFKSAENRMLSFKQIYRELLFSLTSRENREQDFSNKVNMSVIRKITKKLIREARIADSIEEAELFDQVLKETVLHETITAEVLDNWKRMIIRLLEILHCYPSDHRFAGLIIRRLKTLLELFHLKEELLQRGSIIKNNNDFRHFWVSLAELSFSNNPDELLEQLINLFSRVNIHCAYLSLHRDKKTGCYGTSGLPLQTELRLYYNGNKIDYYPGGKTYPTLEILPGREFAFHEDNIFVVQLLHTKEKQFGVLLFEYNSLHCHFYEMISHTLSLQLNRFEQFKQIEQTNKTLDELNKNLEVKVKERTGELERANEKLKGLDNLKNDFIANITHELRTPLTLILGPLESLLAGDYGENVPTKDNSLFGSMHTNSVRLLHLINNLLDFSKLEAGKMKLNKKKINVNKMINFYISSIQSGVGSKGLKLEFIDHKEAVTLSLDPDLIEKAFFNLLSNAMKFSPRGGTISVELAAGKDEVLIHVSDGGIGIPSDKLETIFDRFTQVEGSAARTYEGTGIGLAFTKQIIELHRGHISVTSEVGKGSTFTIHLPLTDEPEVSSAGELTDIQETGDKVIPDSDISHEISSWLTAETAWQQGSTPDGQENMDPNISGEDEGKSEEQKKELILIVDDNSSVLDFIKSLLGKKYRILTARNGKEALAVIEQRKPDLIVSDVMMPEMNGLELCRRLKENDRTARIPLILLTARMDLATRIEGLEGKADDYLLKPFNSRELFVRTRNLLEKYRMEQMLQKTTDALWSEMETARQIQNSLLPEKPAIPGYEIDCYVQSASEVGGDYYDVIHSGSRSWLVIGDVSGHGVNAGLVMMMVQTAISTLLNDNPDTTPARLLASANKTIKDNILKLGQEKYMTISIFVQTEPGRFLYSGLHQDIFIYRAARDTVEILETRGMWIGFMDDISDLVKDDTFEMAKGDTLLLYTDGITEAVRKEWKPGQPGKRFGETKLLRMLKKFGHKRPAEIKGALQHELENYICDDDFTFLIVQRT